VKRLRRLAMSAGIGVVPVVLLAAACGSSGPDQAAAAQTGTAAYLSCLSSHGVTLPSSTGRPSFSPGARASFSPGARASFSPGARPSFSPGADGGGGAGGGFGGFGGGFLGTQAPSGVDQATWTAALQACAPLRPTAGPSGGRGGGNDSATRAYRNCLTEHGATATGPLATDDPTVAAAMAACAPLRPTPASSPAATPG
jgi:hypothetical protein